MINTTRKTKAVVAVEAGIVLDSNDGPDARGNAFQFRLQGGSDGYAFIARLQCPARVNENFWCAGSLSIEYVYSLNYRVSSRISQDHSKTIPSPCRRHAWKRQRRWVYKGKECTTPWHSRHCRMLSL